MNQWSLMAYCERQEGVVYSETSHVFLSVQDYSSYNGLVFVLWDFFFWWVSPLGSILAIFPSLRHRIFEPIAIECERLGIYKQLQSSCLCTLVFLLLVSFTIRQVFGKLSPSHTSDFKPSAIEYERPQVVTMVLSLYFGISSFCSFMWGLLLRKILVQFARSWASDFFFFK